ncbi:NAD(P)-binding domain protein [Niveomyces insectorum RCEF 264]|uniref:NAD(P)-binding domain protein n=1 Tax=Niveomyces insectorum RCEF 264 TaxID=1081102 RepID=A0A167VMW1_9HYPO|nr:NAD(P)-binding domain protein [Niveomyces insectorum RCEF 264]
MASSNHNKVALVTGGGSGIGRAMARYFVDQGYGHVAILDVNEAAGTAVAAELTAAPQQATTVRFVRCNVASWDDQAAAFAAVHAAAGRIDVVMANAGISEGGASSLVAAARAENDAGETPPAQPSLRTLDVNLTGVIYTVHLAIHYLKKNAPSADGGRGSIVCTASNAGLYPFPVAPLYAASKAAVIGLVRSLALPLAPAQIQINALAPAVLETNITDKTLFANMIMTPMTTLVRGVDELVRDATHSGDVAEIHGDRITYRPPTEYVDADTKTNLDAFWNMGYA